MTGQVPQFPGKGGVAQPNKPGPTQAQPAWKTAICPLLTAGELARTPLPTLVQTAGAQPPAMKAQACLGPQCMMFIAMRRADGVEQAGCAPTMAMGQLVGLNLMVSEFIMAAKAGAAAEAAEAEARTKATPLTELTAVSNPVDPAPTPPPTVPAPSPLTDAADAASKED